MLSVPKKEKKLPEPARLPMPQDMVRLIKEQLDYEALERVLRYVDRTDQYITSARIAGSYFSPITKPYSFNPVVIFNNFNITRGIEIIHQILKDIIKQIKTNPKFFKQFSPPFSREYKGPVPDYWGWADLSGIEEQKIIKIIVENIFHYINTTIDAEIETLKRTYAHTPSKPIITGAEYIAKKIKELHEHWVAEHQYRINDIENPGWRDRR